MFSTLLDTSKSYLMNCLRVPALQSLLLYSKSLDTNLNLTRILCDTWLELRFLDSEAAQSLIASAIYLRSSIEKLFQLRLNENQSENAKNAEYQAAKLERTLKKKLTGFLDSDVTYSLRRVLPAELNKIYINKYASPSDNESKSSLPKCLEGFNTNNEIDQVKGGLKITEYLTYNCLVSDQTAEISNEYSGNMQRHWTCKRCNKEYLLNLSERMQHEVECIGQEEEVGFEMKEKDKKVPTAGSQEYKCDVCNEILYLTPVEILKHKKSH
jgi:ATP-dependent RNA helicase DHX34